ncbi:protein serine/threonine phosphatase 2C [Phellopilus nigrolimitatus]|nr:protein serine/threonine phosphatase 2C [Phellopilus nigrolimitatus]
MNVVQLSPASPTADLRALQEVSNFASTDMGWGGEDRWTYRILSEEQITPELLRLCEHGMDGHVDYVTFQPCTSYEARSQDRFVVQNWDMPDGQWVFSGIFDGHGSHSTVDFVVEHLPARVRTALQVALTGGEASSAAISRLLNDSIIEIDNIITRDFLRLFPGGREDFARLSDQEIESIIKHKGEGEYSQNILRCMQGSTALLTLVDPSGTHLWVANLGDCRAGKFPPSTILALLVSKSAVGTFSVRRLSDVHNGGNVQEIQRIVNEHPGESECVLEKRVLGYLAPTRALGDTWMKLPAIYLRRVLMRTKQFWSAGLAEEFAKRIITPPYVSNVPQVCHHRLRRNTNRSEQASTSTGGGETGDVDVALLLCSDGLVDLYEDRDLDEQAYLKRWAAKIGEAITPLLASRPRPSGSFSSHSQPTGAHIAHHREERRENLAVWLLRDAIGGDDISRASANLTVEMDERWIDDTTILVHRFL